MWPKNAAPPGGLAPPPSKSHRVPASLAQGFSPARQPQCVALALPSPTKTEARRAAGVSLYLSNRPVMPATAPGRRHLRGPRGVTHTKAPCASKLPDRQPGRRAPHPVPRTAPPTLTLHKEALPAPWLKDGAPLGSPQPAPPEAGTRARDAHATPSKFALSPRCALNPPSLQEGMCTPNPEAGDTGRPGPLTSSPVHHLFGAPLGHGFHGE